MLSREWGNGVIINSHLGSFSRSLLSTSKADRRDSKIDTSNTKLRRLFLYWKELVQHECLSGSGMFRVYFDVDHVDPCHVSCAIGEHTATR